MSKETPHLSWLQSRNRRGLIFFVVLVVGQFCGFWLLHPFLSGGEVNAWVGWSQEELVRRLGQPEETHDGAYIPIKAVRTVNPPDDPHRTLHFKTWWGRLHLWIWLRRVDGRWVCYRSISYRDGSDFWNETADLWLDARASEGHVKAALSGPVR
jgi:hypothetical protein